MSDPDTPLTSLQFNHASSNTKLVTGVSFTVTATSAVATVNLAANESGQATITISVSDGSTTVSQDFLLTVNPAQAPSLGATRSGNSLTISWDTSVTGFILETTSSLTNPVWTTVSGNNPVTITIGNANQFFRLRKP